MSVPNIFNKKKILFFFINPFLLVWKHRKITMRLVIRQIESQYKGTILGIFWSFMLPLLRLGVYTFVFSTIMGVNFSGQDSSPFSYPIIIFSGLLLFNFFAQSITIAPSLMWINRTYVKQIVFPLEIFPVVSISVSLFNAGINFLILMLFYLFIMGIPYLNALYFFVIIIPLILMTLGLSWLLAAFGVFIRDLSQAIIVVNQFLLFLSPIFYPLERVPKSFQWLLKLNPLSMIVSMSQKTLFENSTPNFLVLTAYIIGSWLLATFGYWSFTNLKKEFADVI